MKRLMILAAAASLLVGGAAQAKPWDHRGDDGRSHGSERSREVHRMLARGENPGHHYGQHKHDWRGHDDHHGLHDRRDDHHRRHDVSGHRDHRHDGLSDRRDRDDRHGHRDHADRR